MNERTPSAPPVILPLPADVVETKWSVMIPAYNCSIYLRETIESVLANDPGVEQMQIEVVDDCSTDADVEKLVSEVGKGRVNYYRQRTNVGSLRNFEACINRANGQWIHILHGDDKIGKGFYDEIDALFTLYPEAGAAFTAIYYIDEEGNRIKVDDAVPRNEGIIKDWLLQIASQNLVQPPAIVVKRKVYEQLGSFFGVHYGEDWEMWARIAANFPVAYSPKNLAMYRYLRKSSISNSSLQSGQTAKDILKVIEIIQNYLPQKQRARIKQEATKNYAKYFAQSAKLIFEDFQNREAGIQQAKLALRMHFNKITLLSLLKLYTKSVLIFLGLKSILDKRKIES